MAITKKTFIDLETVINAEELNAWQDELIRLDAEKLDSLCAAAPYDATETYAVGDLCIKASALYRCSTAIETPEAWTAAHWTETTLAAELLAAAASAAAKYAPVITDTASGSVASIPDGADGLPLVSLVVQINPVQSGSGDPSPVNKRVISGWTGCDISHSGADTSNPDTITETWQAEAGTVYYATIDIVSGVLTVLGAIIDMGKLTYTETASGIRFDIIDGVGSGSQGTPAAFAMCSDYTLYADTVQSISQITLPDNYFVQTTAAGGRARYYIRDDRYNTASTMKAGLSGVQFLYELREPITYQLTAQQVNTLLGTNNIWADCGAVTVEYRADTKLYIDKEIAAAVAAL